MPTAFIAFFLYAIKVCLALGAANYPDNINHLRMIFISIGYYRVSLQKRYVARKASGLNFEENPPTFHEIRSLAGRLYEKERGRDFAQKLLGHTSEMMTLKYLNTRGKRYVML